MLIFAILLVVLIILLLATLPRWSYSKNWGNLPSIIIGAVIILLLLFVLLTMTHVIHMGGMMM